MPIATPLLLASRLAGPNVRGANQPFAFLIAEHMLPSGAMAELQNDFPHYPEAGFFPHQTEDCGPSVNALIAEIVAPEFADALGNRLGVPNMSKLPALVTLCSRLNRRHGTIHTDSKSKVLTALVYLNTDWPHGSQGCLRFLNRIDDIDSLVVSELLPVYGNLAAFKRADNSFHGHLPHEGERMVVQVAWLTSEEELLRKQKRGRFTRWFKKLLGSLDKHFGAGRDKNASHRD
ncbi:MAG: 2OG-Fe(II) oxygenase [Lysobacteraceae bacterium]